MNEEEPLSDGFGADVSLHKKQAAREHIDQICVLIEKYMVWSKQVGDGIPGPFSVTLEDGFARVAFNRVDPEKAWKQAVKIDSYTDLVEKLMHLRICFEASDDEYQGDTFMIVQDANSRFGYLQFGFGSCSGCDALEQCSSPSDYRALASQFEESIKWFASPAQLKEWMIMHDWQGDCCANSKALLQVQGFVATRF